LEQLELQSTDDLVPFASGQEDDGSQGFNRSVLRKWFLPVALLLANASLLLIAGLSPWAVERLYSRGVYPYIARGIGSISGAVPFSVAGLLLIILSAGVAIILYKWACVVRRSHGSRRALLRDSGRHVLCAFGILIFAFQLVWGLNYRRPQLAEVMGFDRSQPDADELEKICREIIAGVNTNYHLVHDNVPANSASPFSNQTALKQYVENAYRANTVFPRNTRLEGYARPKALILEGITARLGIAGIYSPFTAEPNYLDIMPGFDLPFTMAHEMAHARGFAREDEADFVAFVICTSSDEARIRYSGYLSGLRVLSALFSVDRERYKEVAKLLEAGPRRDLKERYEFWGRYNGSATYLGTRVNDLYLKANGIKSGVRNYNDAVSLIIAYSRTKK
jgi:hypothetical protein